MVYLCLHSTAEVLRLHARGQPDGVGLMADAGPLLRRAAATLGHRAGESSVVENKVCFNDSRARLR
jgi:hypothetical protein